MGHGIAAAVREMDHRKAIQLESRQHRNRLDKAIAVIDTVIAELELLNLREQRSVSAPEEKRLSELLGLIPAELCPPVLIGDSVQGVMDDLYDRLDSLLVRRSGPGWDSLRDEESEALAS